MPPEGDCRYSCVHCYEVELSDKENLLVALAVYFILGNFGNADYFLRSAAQTLAATNNHIQKYGMPSLEWALCCLRGVILDVNAAIAATQEEPYSPVYRVQWGEPDVIEQKQAS